MNYGTTVATKLISMDRSKKVGRLTRYFKLNAHIPYDSSTVVYPALVNDRYGVPLWYRTLPRFFEVVTGLKTERKYGNVHLTVKSLISSVANPASGAFLTLDPGSLINIPDSQHGSIHFVF